MSMPNTLLVGDPMQQVYAYHQRTKHSWHAYAQGPDTLDWATQPDPFRRYAGCPVVELPLGAAGLTTPYADLTQPDVVVARPLSVPHLATLLELTFGLSAWKAYGSNRWALRCNPSSGNLHPTEAYVVAGGVAGLDDGVYHYASHDHLLELRCCSAMPPGVWVGLASVHWREAWKYGERAFRYCQHDVGHALAALSYAAAALGWRVRLCDAWSDADIAALLGLDRPDDYAGAEPEFPDLLCRIEGAEPATPVGVDELSDSVMDGVWAGRANTLSRDNQVVWPIIEEVAVAAGKQRSVAAAWRSPLSVPLAALPCRATATALIKQRRSAQSFDGVTPIHAATFYRMLDATLPRIGVAPFDVWPWPPRVHLLLFVHRVVGLTPGLYWFSRRANAAMEFRPVLRNELQWTPVEDTPMHFELYRLAEGDARGAAKSLSCHQDIAGDSAFSLGMLTEFDTVLADGAWGYRRLYWECGLIGQVLYLEAEAAGVRGTGIGCFFDDHVHAVIGMQDTQLQTLYHFTVGGPLEDSRLQTLPPYAHLDTARCAISAK